MPLKLDKDVEKRLIVSIQRYFEDAMEQEISDLQASLLLEFCVKEIGPCVYNLAVRDAQAHLHERVVDLDGTCHQPEFGYWKK